MSWPCLTIVGGVTLAAGDGDGWLPTVDVGCRQWMLAADSVVEVEFAADWLTAWWRWYVQRAKVDVI
jgi:hypothetical protein